jgi:hypothetical protein
MRVRSITVKAKQNGGGVAIYIQKDDATKMKISVGDEFNIVFDEGDPSNAIISKNIGFNPRSILEEMIYQMDRLGPVPTRVSEDGKKSPRGWYAHSTIDEHNKDDFLNISYHNLQLWEAGTPFAGL